MERQLALVGRIFCFLAPSVSPPKWGRSFFGCVWFLVGGRNKNGHRRVTMPVAMFGFVARLSSCDEVECASCFEPSYLLLVHGVF